MNGERRNNRGQVADRGRRRFMTTAAAAGGAVLVTGRAGADRATSRLDALPTEAAEIVRRHGGEFGELGRKA